MPGIVFGSYPERRPHKTPAVVTRLFSLLHQGRATRWADHQRFVSGVRVLQQKIAAESTQMLHDRINRLRAQCACDGLTDALLAETFAVVAVACRRELGVALYDTQLLAARIMLDGHLAEMATGEGKTLAAAVAASTAALAGIPVHVVTANDYLVSRDASNLRALYEALTLKVGAVTQTMATAERRAAYACDITYCTAKELVFDYLRDGVAAPRRSELEQRAAELMGAQAPQRLLRGLCMAIIDEADSILIDEARVPLVLSQAVPDSARSYLEHAWKLSAMLDPATHFQPDVQMRSTRLTAQGRTHLLARVAEDTFKWLNTRHCEETVAMALTARHVLRRGRDFVVEDGRVHIIDETTGRKALGRSWSHGLHQLVELKEGCAPSTQVVTLAQITYQRFFPRYHRLCGMSGTLLESRHELHKLYDLRVVTVPLRQPNCRKFLPSQVFANAEGQWAAVAARAQALHNQGRPILVGTDSVLESESLSRRLAASGLKHSVLNARQDRDEARIIAAAGVAGAITVATNMAGRGTDILLAAASREAGGLHVICCQQNAEHRIDRQLLGRCARHGDPGSAEYFVSLEGPLLASSWIARIIKKSFKNNELLYSMLGKLELRRAQRAAESRHASERAALLRHDQQMGDWLTFSGPEQ